MTFDPTMPTEDQVAWYQEHGKLWRAFGNAIRGGDEKRTHRAEHEMEAHLGGPWMPAGKHGQFDERRNGE